MAFSLRKMLSNITYFKKPGEGGSPENDTPDDPDLLLSRRTSYLPSDRIDFERTEPDSTSKYATSLILPNSVKDLAEKKGSLSDTEVKNADNSDERRKSKKLKLDIDKANSPERLNCSEVLGNVENTPTHILLDCKSSDIFSDRFKGLDFDKSFDIYDDRIPSPFQEEDIDIESLSDNSDSDDASAESNSDENSGIKMCRKVEQFEPAHDERQLVPSTTPESFADVEVDKNEEERITLLLNYQMKLEKIECFLKKLLTEFQFHIEVSKIFHCRSVVTTLPGTDVTNIPKILGDVTYLDNVSRGESPSGSWNIVLEKEDKATKFKVRKQLLSLRRSIDEFLSNNVQDADRAKKLVRKSRRGITFDVHKGKRVQHKPLRVNQKKKMKHFDFPDIRDAMINLFTTNFDKDDYSVSSNNITSLLSDSDESDVKCACRCHFRRSPSSQDSGLISKTNDRSLSSQSITSSLGNFSLDTSTLTAYSESLDLIVSYNSFQDTSLYSTLLQKAAIERITFYVQVHSIQLKCESTDRDLESKNTITFYCPSCKITETDENGLLKHILGQKHCEKIHFLYKTAYIKKCMSAGKEIMPSTVLNSMKMYRDDNKIVCFGEAMYACSLCFESLIMGESVLMAHCSEPEHVERRDRLSEIVE